MSEKISQMTPVSAAQLTDLKEVTQSGATFSESNQQLLTLFNLNAQLASPNQVTNGAYAGGVLSVSSNTTLTYPLPNWIFCDTTSGVITITFPAFDLTKCRLGQTIIVINTGSVNGNFVRFKNSLGNQFFGDLQRDQTAFIELNAAAPDSIGGKIYGTMSVLDEPTWWSSDAATVLTNIGGAPFETVNTVTQDGSAIVLTNPMANVQNVILKNNSTFQLAAVNGQTPRWQGRSMLIFNNGDQTISNSTTFNIYAQDGTTVLYPTIPFKTGVLLTCVDDSTANGTWLVDSLLNSRISRVVQGDGAVDATLINTVLESISPSTGIFTAPLIGSAGMTRGFNFWIKNSSTSSVNFTPTPSNTIDGKSILYIPPGQTAWIYCNGSSWITLNNGLQTPLNSTSFSVGTSVRTLSSPLSNIYNITATDPTAIIKLAALNTSNVSKGSIIIFKNVSTIQFRLEDSAVGVICDVYAGQTAILQINDVSTAAGSIGFDIIGPGVTPITDSTTARTLSAVDFGKVIKFTNASAITVTVPNLGIGFNCTVVQGGAGQITLVGSGMTLNSAGGVLKTNLQYSPADIYQDTTSTAFVWGDLVA